MRLTGQGKASANESTGAAWENRSRINFLTEIFLDPTSRCLPFRSAQNKHIAAAFDSPRTVRKHSTLTAPCFSTTKPPTGGFVGETIGAAWENRSGVACFYSRKLLKNTALTTLTRRQALPSVVLYTASAVRLLSDLTTQRPQHIRVVV